MSTNFDEQYIIAKHIFLFYMASFYSVIFTWLIIKWALFESLEDKLRVPIPLQILKNHVNMGVDRDVLSCDGNTYLEGESIRKKR